MRYLNPLFSVGSTALLLLFLSVGLAFGASVAQWERFETTLTSSTAYKNPVQEADLTATFTSMTGESQTVPGFWDGANTWKVRFSPNRVGKWTYVTRCSDAANPGLHDQKGELLCTVPSNRNRFQEHGPIKVSSDDRYLIHEDSTPFLYLADTAWNGPLLATDADWATYLAERKRQKFTAVQWVATQWRAAPDGDRLKQKAFTGTTTIEINTAFFQRLDKKIDAINEAGLLSVPVLLWAIASGSDPAVNPGHSLPEDQAAILARYMVARWGANDVIWILGGDGDYRGSKAERWKNIGRGVFDGISHAPVAMHPGGMQWVWEEFKNEKWLGIFGYQSGHGDDEKTLKWMIDGPPTTDWQRLPHRPFINLEPPYENHIAYQSKTPISAATVRRAMYWSMLNAPTAGIGYGGHGVWGWDDGTQPPTDHAGSGTPLPWKDALKMEGAEQIQHLHDYFTSVDFWRLRPAPPAVSDQPGAKSPASYISAARTDAKDLLVLYIPEARTISVKLDMLPPSPEVSWFNPQNGSNSPAVAVVTANTVQFPTPSEGDWILSMKTDEKKLAEAAARSQAAEAVKDPQP